MATPKINLENTDHGNPVDARNHRELPQLLGERSSDLHQRSRSGERLRPLRELPGEGDDSCPWGDGDPGSPRDPDGVESLPLKKRYPNGVSPVPTPWVYHPKTDAGRTKYFRTERYLYHYEAHIKAWSERGLAKLAACRKDPSKLARERCKEQDKRKYERKKAKRREEGIKLALSPTTSYTWKGFTEHKNQPFLFAHLPPELRPKAWYWFYFYKRIFDSRGKTKNIYRALAVANAVRRVTWTKEAMTTRIRSSMAKRRYWRKQLIKESVEQANLTRARDKNKYKSRSSFNGLEGV